MSQAHLAELTAAKTAARRIRRTAGVAKASAWTTGVLAGCTLLGVLFGDITALVLGAALMVVAVREGLLGVRLGAFDESAPRRLSVNQLILGAIIVVYAAWQGWNAWRSPGVSGAEELVGQSPGMDALLNDVGSLTRTISIGFYLVVAIGGALGTSLMALYYWRRTAMVRAFISQQPDWILQTMRAAA